MSRRRWTSLLALPLIALSIPVVSGAQAAETAATPVAANGQLRVCGVKLCNEQNRPVQLRGMSTHGIQWYADCVNDASIDALAHDWGADVMRISMYVQEGGYETDPAGFTNRVSAIIDEVTARGMYAIVDWHMLSPGDPHYNLSRAKTFFTEIARRHNGNKNLLYEIANEPSGVSWSRIKSYAEQLIPVIRAVDPETPILVGTRAWSSLGVSEGATETEVVNNPVNASNIMYTFHFYAASHRDEYLNALSRAADRIPMFVTEFGTQDYAGEGPNDFAMAQRYLDLMARKQISWTNWNYSDDHRSGAVFTEGTCPSGPYTGTTRLKEAGKWVRDRVREGGTPGDPPGDAPLISRGKPVTASSVETSSLTPDKAVDGSTTTRWASAEGIDPQWIRVDLGSGSTVSRVRLNWETAYARAYRVEISADGTNWTRLATETAGNGGIDDWTNLSGSGRYLRVYGTVRGTQWGYSLWELEVYGASAPSTGAFTVVGAGDIADQCTASQSTCMHFKTAARAEAINPAFYITMGDNQYDDAHIEDFRAYYDKSWGRFKAKTFPVPGNHEAYDDWENQDERAYREYFGSRATPQGKMWYSYNHGNWHFIALNSNRFDEREQLDWLRADLAANTRQCVAAYFHHPLFSSGDHGNDPVSRPVWQLLRNANVELVLSGHDHHYERFAPQNPDGSADPNGIVEVIGGTGGKDLYGAGDSVQDNSVTRIWDRFGVVRLDFTDTTFRVSFVDVDGAVRDAGPTQSCH
ncbi:cellulase family glycosylhydrolase [Actinokineospora sp. UTMC 2448]|uniref:cellulase family glycosylhydrolase n=1 Tax=Actinokineospora sp. UTMC 2448 TaxID=2268449 RepID=UPI002164D0FD|nr:cellulase family glycosylhydrolase [Actinokineospora sp. UTMC 2448]UVS78180.1 Endoglucanase E-5 precursor [Actinokineospora sp. UTMC 2448]